MAGGTVYPYNTFEDDVMAVYIVIELDEETYVERFPRGIQRLDCPFESV